MLDIFDITLLIDEAIPDRKYNPYIGYVYLGKPKISAGT